ncbi:sulfate adenylyltransferase subunit 1 [Brumimicrobium oceani]|uniref:sulfate adenylyltransferase n=1 Tax=Brumimicrobium oceani TaxID=2100725 RepID=A0A2U2XAR7_9FLAO|nr:GTP-binding protein [Brumimicrobium oceani]PWH84801.1 sulfate adenylyltransferase [Brumimicrobium oceani]
MVGNKNKVLKLSTAGSVDDGKSTLIGRILYDTHSLTDDKLEAIERSSKQKGYDYLDFSLATDGLVAEREQGITIDVAHIYFSTKNRSYIIADTPGHVEYTRNMVTGTSTSQVSIILIDARKGVIEQTKRHFFINNLLRTKEIVVAVNKMDLIDFSQEKYEAIVEDFKLLISDSEYKEQNITFIPVSALHGDNVVDKSENLSWFKGETMMEHLENIRLEDIQEEAKARFQVQTVIRPKTDEFHDFRGYAGKLKGGELKVGDDVTVLPSGRKSQIKSISFFDQQYLAASKGSSITITLMDDVNVSRGDLIVKSEELPQESKTISAKICWMDNQPLLASSTYFLQHGVKLVKSKIKTIEHKISTDNTGEIEKVSQLNMNDLGLVEIQLAQVLNFDSYNENKGNGAFILIDAKSNTTAGVGFWEVEVAFDK